MRHLIGILFSYLHASPILLPIYNLLKVTGLHRLGHVIFDFFERIYPTEKMKSEKIIFEEHKAELKKAYHLLEDEKSKDVFKKTMKFRTTKNRMFLRGIIEGNQYFVKGIISPSNSEVFIDCGGFDGDTLRNYLKFNRNYRKIIIFEPTAKNLKRIQNYCRQKNLKNIVCIEAGVGEKSETAYFSNKGTADAYVSDSGTTQIQIFALDELEECQDATFIKMDIEGSEMAALKGAKNIIIRNKPKLAICIYHKPEDYYQIPLYLKSLVPEYKFYVRHHFYGYSETVLYAVL